MDPELLQAARAGDKSLVENLLAKTIQISITIPPNTVRPTQPILLGVTIGGNTALHIAASHGHLELVSLLCRREISLAVARNAMRETALHCAARAGHHRVVEAIISFLKKERRVAVAETVVRARDRDGRTALYEAVQNGYVKVVEVLMSVDVGLADVVDEEGVSPVYLAVVVGSPALLRAFLRPSSYAGPKGQNALHAAALFRNTEIAKQLLEWDEKLARSGDVSGSTPLHFAASYGNDRMVELLLNKDTSLAYIADLDGLFPLQVAAIRGKVRVIHELIKRCPDSDELLDGKGRNLLHTAVQHRKIEIVKYVCKRSELAKLMNARDYDGNTPLHLAVQNGDQEIVSELMGNKSVNPNIMNKKGLTPLDLSIIGAESGLTYVMNPSMWIHWCLTQSGAIESPRRVDHHLLRDYIIPKRDSKEEDLEKESKKHTYTTQSFVIASVLIATVTFAAAFTLPGGYKSDDGTPVLAKKYAFKAFVIANSIAFVFSILTTCWITFGGSLLVQHSIRSIYLVSSSVLLVTAIRSMTVAFALGVYLTINSNFTGVAACVMISTSVLLIDSPTKFQIFRLGKTVKRRRGWKDLMFKVPPLPHVNLKFAVYILARILFAALPYIVIFLLPLL